MMLVQFLLARITETEALARAASNAPWIALTMYPNRSEVANGSGIDGGLIVSTPRKDDADVAHIARHDPAAVLARCAADRRIVELHGDDQSNCMGGYVEGLTHRQVIESEYLNGRPTGYCDTLLALVQPYADHADFDPAWLREEATA